MTGFDAWGDAIGFERDSEGLPSLDTVLGHIRGAVLEAGFVSRGRISTGLKEAYRPLGVDDVALRSLIDDALRVLLLSGDLDVFTTESGRGYAATSPRRIDWGGSQVALLGSAIGAVTGLAVRRAPSAATFPDTITHGLTDELGRPEWRGALVELGAADAPEDSVAALFRVVQTLAGGGERYSLDEPQSVAVLSGRGRYFGQAEKTPSGRWQRIGADGCFPAIIKSGFVPRNVVLNITNGTATLWQPASLDLWHWVVVGATLAAGDQVLSYDAPTAKLFFLTPPPRQVERAALLTGTQVGPWSWEVDAKAYAVIGGLMDSAL